MGEKMGRTFIADKVAYESIVTSRFINVHKDIIKVSIGP